MIFYFYFSDLNLRFLRQGGVTAGVDGGVSEVFGQMRVASGFRRHYEEICLCGQG